MIKKVNVVPVTIPPAIGKVEMQQGIRSKEEAEHWADKHGYAVVYWLKSRQRVYADKLTKRVDVLAQEILTKSSRLVQVSEQGQGGVEVVLLIALVVIVVLALGKCGMPL